MPHYEVVAYARVPAQATAPTFTELDRVPFNAGEHSGGGGISWSRELLSDGSITVSADPTKLPDSIASKLLDLDNNPMELALYRDGVLTQRGPLIAWQVQGRTITLLARGLLYYLRYMRITSTLEYTATEQATIVKGLIDHHQNKDYGNFGLDTSTIASTGVTRTRDFDPVDLVLTHEEIREMAEATDGFDIRVDPSTRAVTLHSPTYGTDKTDLVILDERGIVDPELSSVVTAGQFGSAALVAGINKDGNHISSEQIDTTVRNAWGLAYVSHSVIGVSGQTELDNIAAQTRDIAKVELLQPTKEFSSVTGASYDDFEPGDTVSYEYNPGFGRIKYDGRVKNQFVSIAESGTEKLTIDFV